LLTEDFFVKIDPGHAEGTVRFRFLRK